MRNVDHRARSVRRSARTARSVLVAAMALACAVALASCAVGIDGSAERGDAHLGTLGTTGTTGGRCVIGAAGSNCSVPTGQSGAGSEAPDAAGSAPAPISPASAPAPSSPAPTPSSPAPASDRPAATTESPAATAGRSSRAASSSAPTTRSATRRTTRSATPGNIATASIATVDEHGIITIRRPGATDAVVLDIYEDALCPFCGRFEQGYGRQIRQAIERGRLAVRYRMVTFLDQRSASGSYSTRAFAAMLALASDSGNRPGLLAAFHATLFDPGVQPPEGGDADLTDAQLADLARRAGAPAKAVHDITVGRFVDRARAAATANLEQLGRDSPTPGTPTVTHDHAVLPITDPDWLDAILGG